MASFGDRALSSDRIDVSELKDKGIYLDREVDLKQRLERSMRSDQLSKSLRSRPYMCVIVQQNGNHVFFLIVPHLKSSKISPNKSAINITGGHINNSDQGRVGSDRVG